MNKHLIGSMWDTICQYRWNLLVATVSILISNLLVILNPLILRQALLSTVVYPAVEEHNFLTPILDSFLGASIHSVYPWVLLLLAVATVSACFKYLMRFIFTRIGREVEAAVRKKIFERIQMQSRAFFDRHGIGDLLSRLTNDIIAYRDLLGPGLMYPLFATTLVIPALIALYSISPWMAAISLIPIVTIFFFNLVIRYPLYSASHDVQQALGEMSVMAHEHFSGIRLIKAYGAEDKASTLFRTLCHQFSRYHFRFSCFQGILFPSLSLITRITTVILVLTAGASILLGWQPMSMADFLSFMWIQSYVFTPLMMVAWILPMYQRGKAGYDRLVEIYEEPIEVQDNPSGEGSISSKADIEFINLTYTYPGQLTPALKGINLCIPEGCFLGITGPIGSGKSTLFRLLNREYEIPRNTLMIHGRDIHEYSLHALHQAIVSVEQLPFLFSKSVSDNIRFGKQHATQEEIEGVSRQVDLHDTILGFPEEYQTMVGERGVSLSGGQKQRIAIARAFLVDHSIILLDDIFSSLDAETEMRIFQSIKENLKGKTVLLITYRASILEQMDRVVCLRGGEIVEEGTPQELLRRRGFFEALVTIQKRGSDGR